MLSDKYLTALMIVIFLLLIILVCVRRGTCMSSKGFGQVGDKNKRGFQVPNTFFEFVKQPLMSNYTSCVEAWYFS